MVRPVCDEQDREAGIFVQSGHDRQARRTRQAQGLHRLSPSKSRKHLLIFCELLDPFYYHRKMESPAAYASTALPLNLFMAAFKPLTTYSKTASSACPRISGRSFRSSLEKS